jgi:hypothetical protein
MPRDNIERQIFKQFYASFQKPGNVFIPIVLITLARNVDPVRVQVGAA